MASENITLYIKGDRNVEVTEQDVFLKDIVSMECSDKKFLPKLQTVKILKLHGNREQRYVVSVLEIIACIHAAYPEVEVQNLGEADIIVTYENHSAISLAYPQSGSCGSNYLFWLGIFNHGI